MDTAKRNYTTVNNNDRWYAAWNNLEVLLCE